MFDQSAVEGRNRVLIASANAEDRGRIGEAAKAAGLRTVGFIRDAEQVSPRTLLSMPDVLLMDSEMYLSMQTQRTRLADLHNAGPIKIVLCGHPLSPQLASQWKREGVGGMLDLADPAAKGLEGLASLLRKKLGGGKVAIAAPDAVPPARVPHACGTVRKTLVPGCVVIGSSTGGPMALMALCTALPADFPLPIAVVQHMPPGFTRMLAERLDAECAVRVLEAEAGMSFEAGTVYIAPGGSHMVLTGSSKSAWIDLNTEVPENSCRPAVDVLFRSSAAVFGGHQHTIVLTGMGRDGLIGATQLHGLGSRIVVQDAATSTVWGMPGAIAQLGLADDILPIDQIAPHLMRCL